MNPFLYELQSLETLYNALETRLEEQLQSLDSGLTENPAKELQAARLEESIVEAERRIALLTHPSPAGIPAVSFKDPEIAALAERLRTRGRQLLVLIERNILQCRQFQLAARESLYGLQTGARYLQSVKSPREPQPRYIDSCQ